MQEYKTISGVSVAKIVEKKSEFIASAAFADTQQAALAFLNDIKIKNSGAAHNVFAYILKQGATERYSDDGEPAKTAGVPTLSVIRHAGLVNCIVVTTRYFGGTLLGTGGLVRAYTQAAKAALDNAKIVCVSVCIKAEISIPYALYEQAARVITQNGAKLDDAVFKDDVTLPFIMLKSQKEHIEKDLQTLCKGNAKIVFSNPFNAPF